MVVTLVMMIKRGIFGGYLFDEEASCQIDMDMDSLCSVQCTESANLRNILF